MILPPKPIHPEGEQKQIQKRSKDNQIGVDTFDGKVFVEWDPEAAVTPLALLPFFIEFLKIGDRFDPWVEACPLYYTSHNAPDKRDVLGSLFLSILSGHKRFAHITTLRSDETNAKLLGMNKIVSDDSARRGLKKIDEDAGIAWMQEHLGRSYDLILESPWILDCDVTIKPLFGHQEGAVVGYNPHKPGRPSHTYHSYIAANLRLILDVEVQPGNQASASHSLPGLVQLIERLGERSRPQFVRGDCDWGTDTVMSELELLGMDYLFKIKKHKSVKTLIYEHHGEGSWVLFKDNWEAKESRLELQGWGKSRRVVLVRRRIQKDSIFGLEHESLPKQLCLATLEAPEDMKLYEYSVLVTSLDADLISIIQHYRDRADCENIFDEIKNQWAWGGFTTRDIKTSRIMSRMTAMIYNWWNLFVRLANPDGYQEAITSRPLLLTAIGRLTESGRQKTMYITSQHGWAEKARAILTGVSEFFSSWKENAPQLTSAARWGKIITEIVLKFAKQKGVGPPGLEYSGN